jgi:hypothetical protein
MVDGLRAALAHGDAERLGARIHPERTGTPARRLQRVHAVAAADVEQAPAGSEVREVPIMRVVVTEQVLGVHVLGALAGPPREADGEPLGLVVGHDEAREAQAAERPRDHRASRIAT